MDLLRIFYIDGIKHTMQAINGEDDDNIEAEFTNPVTGKPNWTSIWTRRISIGLVEPKMNEQEVTALPRKYRQALRLQWVMLNDPGPDTFLPPGKPATSGVNGTSTMPLQSSESSQTLGSDSQGETGNI